MLKQFITADIFPESGMRLTSDSYSTSVRITEIGKWKEQVRATKKERERERDGDEQSHKKTKNAWKIADGRKTH